MGFVEVDVYNFILFGLVGGQSQFICKNSGEKSVKNVVDPLNINIGVAANVAALDGEHNYSGLGDNGSRDGAIADYTHLAKEVSLAF